MGSRSSASTLALNLVPQVAAKHQSAQPRNLSTSYSAPVLGAIRQTPVSTRCNCESSAKAVTASAALTRATLPLYRGSAAHLQSQTVSSPRFSSTLTSKTGERIASGASNLRDSDEVEE